MISISDLGGTCSTGDEGTLVSVWSCFIADEGTLASVWFFGTCSVGDVGFLAGESPLTVAGGGGLRTTEAGGGGRDGTLVPLPLRGRYIPTVTGGVGVVVLVTAGGGGWGLIEGVTPPEATTGGCGCCCLEKDGMFSLVAGTGEGDLFGVPDEVAPTIPATFPAVIPSRLGASAVLSLAGTERSIPRSRLTRKRWNTFASSLGLVGEGAVIVDCFLLCTLKGW